MFSRILVGLDGSEYSVKALEFAIDLAKKYRSQLVLVHVVMRQIYAINPPEAGILAGTAIVRELEAEGKAILAKGEETVKAQGLPVEVRLRQGVPAEELLRAAADEKADLIVLGSRGLSQVKAFLLGSVSDKVSHHAKCPILIVR
ncbi:MAG: universal stress protein [Candidatus Bathyarchaeota archaeon]|nr:universal stress protein [Candidatus Bathyarchaeota archaeon]